MTAMRLILLLVLSHLIVGPAMAGTISGPATVIDAATLSVGGQVVRLKGIAVPKPGDRCPLRNVTIRCGHVAKSALEDLTAGAVVHCRTHGVSNRQGAVSATCTAGDYDLAEGMIYTGWARPDKSATARYREVEKSARKRKRGLWHGEFPDAVNRAAGRR